MQQHQAMPKTQPPPIPVRIWTRHRAVRAPLTRGTSYELVDFQKISLKIMSNRGLNIINLIFWGTWLFEKVKFKDNSDDSADLNVNVLPLEAVTKLFIFKVGM